MSKPGEEIFIGKEVIKKEANALLLLANLLNDSFTKAVNMIKNTTGNIIVTGMGKSGIIGRKIAATLTSTGKPSFFIHPGDASHGDLGMISRKDCVFIISNSGETQELFAVLDYCKRYGIKTISMTKNNNSTIATHSNIVLLLPPHEEACPLGLAPTTSTTLCLALGDAIAIAVYKEEFNSANFAEYHPGGKLGSKLLKVAHIMHTGNELPIIDISSNIGEAILEMTKKALGCVGVLDKGHLAGIITDGDLRRYIHNIPIQSLVAEIMTCTPKVTSPDTLASEALKYMNDNKISSLFVLDEKRPVGVIHMHDCLRAGVDKG